MGAKLSAIAAGKLKSAVFIKDMKTYAGKTVKEIKNSSQTFRHDNISGTACPDCGKMMLKVNGKRGTMLVCQDRECGSRKTLARKQTPAVRTVIRKWSFAARAKAKPSHVYAATGRNCPSLKSARRKINPDAHPSGTSTLI